MCVITALFGKPTQCALRIYICIYHYIYSIYLYLSKSKSLSVNQTNSSWRLEAHEGVASEYVSSKWGAYSGYNSGSRQLGSNSYGHLQRYCSEPIALRQRILDYLSWPTEKLTRALLCVIVILSVLPRDLALMDSIVIILISQSVSILLFKAIALNIVNFEYRNKLLNQAFD